MSCKSRKLFGINDATRLDLQNPQSHNFPSLLQKSATFLLEWKEKNGDIVIINIITTSVITVSM